MLQSKRNTARAAAAAAAAAAAVEQFDVAAWRAELCTAFTDLASAATRTLHVVLAGRGKVEAETAREALGDAFEAAGMLRGSKAWKNRVADAMVIFKAESLPSGMPSNLQQAAAAVRKHRVETGKVAARKPRPGKTDTSPKAGDPAPLVELAKAIERVRSIQGLSEAALDLVGELVDLAGDLAEAILGGSHD